MKSTGKFLTILGVLVGIFALFFFDPSISTGDTRVVNLQLLSFQQNLIIISALAVIIGVLLLLFGPEPSQVSRQQGGSIVRPTGDLLIEEQFADAVKRNDRALMQKLLSSREVSAHGRNRNGRGWLQFATVMGSIESAKVLLSHGASPNDKDGLGRTSLEEARASKSDELVALFSDSKGDS